MLITPVAVVILILIDSAILFGLINPDICCQIRVEEDTPVIAISTEESLYDKTESNVREVRSRGAYVILLCREDAKNAEASADAVIRLPIASEAATLFASLAAVQVISYEAAVLRGCDIDRPRNLAKSVTVE